ncbi:MAG TPA: (Fe-S)-binding protein [Bacteroidia bacterium]|nr:(Fe-S)-binding protein [Bacteroidia bacterium]HNT79953.1 (Fe-S)-binding protein [Bacteroidia bacterium]
MQYISSLLFILCLGTGIYLFATKVKKIRRNILLGKDLNRSDNPSARWKNMIRVALGQSKMVSRPVAGLLHILVYAGFIIINIEVIEIIIDGIFGTHRVFSVLGFFYDFLIASFELLAVLVILACAIFLIRRNVLKIKRFWNKEMTTWPRNDANIILVSEIILMSLFLFMNAADLQLQSIGSAHYSQAGAFPFSGIIANSFLSTLNESTLIAIERSCWWLHILGILAFLNYVPYSKHFHIFLAFPNTYYANLEPKGKFGNMDTVTQEVKLMLNLPVENAEQNQSAPQPFGARDVQDLTWKNLMDAYSCTECGRCTSACPANITGKKLSPRKIMMDTRDRVEEVGKGIDQNGKEFTDNKALLGDYISAEELWACTSCNACVDACPVNIDPLNIIIEMRRYLVMEKSEAPAELNGMFTRLENNSAPWQFAQSDRMNWAKENE